MAVGGPTSDDLETKRSSLNRLSALLTMGALLPLAIRSSGIRGALRSAAVKTPWLLHNPETTTAALMRRLEDPRVADWVDRTLAHVGGTTDPGLQYLGHGIDAAAFRIKPPGDLVLKLFPSGISKHAKELGRLTETPEVASLLQHERFPDRPKESPFDLFLQPYVEKIDKLAQAWPGGHGGRSWTIPLAPHIDPTFRGQSVDQILQWLSKRLTEQGFSTTDMHTGNVGFLEGHPVVFDLGSVYSR